MAYKDIGQSVTSPVSNTRRKELRIENPPTFTLHVDADRDGSVDTSTDSIDKWNWGKGNKGAVILVNSNGVFNTVTKPAAARSPATIAASIDNEDDIVNGNDDIKDLAPLDIRRSGSAPPAGGKLTLYVSSEDQFRIRIFDSRTSSGKEIIGPSTGASHDFTDLSFNTKELGMEATCYAGLDPKGKKFDGLIQINLEVRLSGKTSLRKAVVRVAPWIMFNHFDKPEKIYVFDDAAHNGPFVMALEAASGKAGVALEKVPLSRWAYDRWMQDILEFGYSQLPGNPALRNTLETPRGRELENFPKTFISSEMAFYKPAAPQAPVPSSLDAGGNLECTPPFTDKKGKRHPFGRIYISPTRKHATSDRIANGYEKFLRAQHIQKPIEIDAGWLSVGHVDEIISFVPATSKLGFKLLLASPNLGFDLLRKEPSTSRILMGRTDPSGRGAEISVSDFLSRGITWNGFPYLSKILTDYNMLCQSIIDKAERIFTRELNLVASDIATVPAIYVPGHPTEAAPESAHAMTAAMVNMLVVGSHCIAPKPFGPTNAAGVDRFEEHFRSTLTACGLTIDFVDDWDTYHLLQGEVHCGTNTLRVPKGNTPWWEFEP